MIQSKNIKVQSVFYKLRLFCKNYKSKKEYFIENSQIFKYLNLEKKHTCIFKKQTFFDFFNNDKIIDIIDHDQPESRSVVIKNLNSKYSMGVTTPPGLFNNKIILINEQHIIKIDNQEIKNRLVPRNKYLFIMEIIKKYQEIAPDNIITTPQIICVQICKDQDGSRYIQNQLTMWNFIEISIFYRYIYCYIRELSTNLFGNYVIQKLLPLLNENQLSEIEIELRGYVSDLSFNMFGCRVIQLFLSIHNNIITILNEIQQNIEIYIIDQFGNHVIKKCIEISSKIQNKSFLDHIFKLFIKNGVMYSKNKYGCRLVQEILTTFSLNDLQELADALLKEAHLLISDQYGNYVVQILISNFDCSEFINNYIINHCKQLSLCKYSSNIIEKVVKEASNEIQNQFFNYFNTYENGTSFILTMLKDGHANYVIQTIYINGTEEQKHIIQKIIFENYEELKDIPYFKSIQNKLQIKK